MSKESFRDEINRMRRQQARHIGHVVEAFRAAAAIGSTAIRGKGYGIKPTMAIMSGELTDRDQGSLRLTFFGQDGPHGHVTRRTTAEIHQEAARVLEDPVEPMSEAEVMAWTSTPEFEIGSRVVAYIQAENAFRHYAGRAGRSDWAADIIRHANDVGTAGGTHRGTVESVEAATKILTDAMHELPTPNGRYRPNPAWVTAALAGSYETLEAKVPPQWLPKLDRVTAKRGRLAGRMPELGCGAYGCVLDTLDPGVVLKVTTDSTEAQFAAELAEDLAAPIVVEYKMVIALAQHHQGRPVYALWREAADAVGQLGAEVSKTAEQYVIDQHNAATEAVLLIADGRSLRKIRPKILAWLDTCDAMAEAHDAPELRALGRGMAHVYRTQHIFFGDVHAGNLGRVTRDGKPSWLITDPGNVIVIDVL